VCVFLLTLLCRVACPSLSLYLSLSFLQWFNAYPGARFFAAPGLPEKRTDIKFDIVLNDRADSSWTEEIDQMVIKGNPDYNEVVFYHRNSKTLIVADLLLYYCEPYDGRSV
jgi:hypothetical protein